MTTHRHPGAHLALSVIHPISPVLRVRYRNGVLMNPFGCPDWLLYARACVEVPDVATVLSGLGGPLEARIATVVAANELMATSDDPLWAFTADDFVARTPPGWTWAHLPPERNGDSTHRMALVPIELHGAFRHAGGAGRFGVPGADDGTRGSTTCDELSQPVAVAADQCLAEEVVAGIEKEIDCTLPPAYRRFLTDSNGGYPRDAAVLPGFGFVVDQQLFGVSRPDRHQELTYAAAWLTDRLTTDWLAIGYVQGGVLAVKIRGNDLDSIWYLDDDDPRDEDGFDAEYLCAHLLQRCADSIDDFWRRLRTPAGTLLNWVDARVKERRIREYRPELAGASLPSSRRAPWQPAGVRSNRPDPVVRLFTQP